MSLGQLTFQAQARLQLAEATRERGELALALGEARAERTMAWAQAYRDSCEQSPTGRRHDADVTVAHLDARIAHLESAVDVTRSQVGQVCLNPYPELRLC